MIVYLAYLLMFWPLLSKYGAGGNQLSNEEHDWDKQFELLNKPSVKTIKTRYGDIYDCVDFYKQPAFDHPLLKNHSFHPQMRPSFSPKRMKTTTLSNENRILLDAMKLEDGGCPTGTVPIRRISRGDFIRIKRITEVYASRNNHNNIDPQPGTNFAIIQTKSNPLTTIYNGVQATFSIYGLPIEPSQYSSGELIIQNGNDRIQVGWTVNPTVNKDNRTRLFQYLNAGQSHCFNVLCPGFISVREDMPIDMILEPVSKLGEQPYMNLFFIYQDPKSGNWWLEIGRDGTVIGFWPREIFTSLAKSATYIAVGGEAYSPPGQPLAPMGSGYPLVPDTRLSAQASEIYVLDANYKSIEPQDTEKYTNNDQYDVLDKGHQKHWGRLIFYGKRFII